jgi:hypothetical protein
MRAVRVTKVVPEELPKANDAPAAEASMGVPLKLSAGELGPAPAG